MPQFPLVEEPGDKPLTVPQGSTWSKRFAWGRFTDPDNPDPTARLASFEGFDLTGALIRCQIRPDRGSKTLLFSFRTDNGRIDFDESLAGSNGAFTLNMTAEESAGLKADVFRYDVEVVDQTGSVDVVSRPFGGTFTIDGEVTLDDL